MENSKVSTVRAYFDPQKLIFVSESRSGKSAESQLKTLEEVRQKGEFILDKLSGSSKRKLLRSLDWFFFSIRERAGSYGRFQEWCKNRVAVVTLTLASKMFTNCKFVKSQCLNRLLSAVRKKYPETLYVWKAERTSAGRLHFHVVFDRYIPWKWLNDLWYKILADNGYTRDYDDLNTGKIPKCVDVRGVKKVDNLRAYLSKYLTKGGVGTPIDGRLWGCCYRLSGLGGVACEMTVDEYLCLVEAMTVKGVFNRKLDYGYFWAADWVKVFDNESNILTSMLRHYFFRNVVDVYDVSTLTLGSKTDVFSVPEVIVGCSDYSTQYSFLF